jgi:hypothetical protein
MRENWLRSIRKFWLLAGFFLAASPGLAQGPAIVQHVAKDCGAGPACSQAFASPNAAANFLAVAIRAGGASPTVTVKDTLLNAYTLIGSCPNAADPHVSFLYFARAAAGANAVNVAAANASSVRISVAEISGVGALDGFSCNSGTSAAASSGPIATKAADLVLGTVTTANSQTFAAGAGFATIDSAGKIFDEFEVQSAAGPATASATLSTSDKWASMVAAFSPSVSAPPPPPPPPPVPAQASFACTPGFRAVTFSAFVPSGAKGYSFSIQNYSAVPLVITQVTPPVGFAMDANPAMPVTIAIGDAQTFTIRFVPTAPGIYAGNVIFLANVVNGDFFMGVQATAN